MIATPGLSLCAGVSRRARMRIEQFRRELTGVMMSRKLLGQEPAIPTLVLDVIS